MPWQIDSVTVKDPIEYEWSIPEIDANLVGRPTFSLYKRCRLTFPAAITSAEWAAWYAAATDGASHTWSLREPGHTAFVSYTGYAHILNNTGGKNYYTFAAEVEIYHLL